jgi:uncharacterized protein (UPF0548 family)
MPATSPDDPSTGIQGRGRQHRTSIAPAAELKAAASITCCHWPCVVVRLGFACACDHEVMSDLTYPEHLRGTSLAIARGARVIPGEWHVLHLSQVVGQGEVNFRAASDRLMSLAMHRAAGLRVEASGLSGRVHVDDTVSIEFGWPPSLVRANCLVVGVIDTGKEVGFAYGTLSGHPERGEEGFLVRLNPDGRVTGSVAAFSQPASLIGRLGGPVTRAIQHRFAQRYLDAMLPRRKQRPT